MYDDQTESLITLGFQLVGVYSEGQWLDEPGAFTGSLHAAQMHRLTPISLIAALTVLTLATLTVWWATGSDYYTKTQVVEQVQVPVNENDPLAGTGFYEEEGTQVKTVRRDEFRLGLFPTPTRLWDANMLSVVSILAPLWVAGLVVFWFSRQRQSNASPR